MEVFKLNLRFSFSLFELVVLTCNEPGEMKATNQRN